MNDKEIVKDRINIIEYISKRYSTHKVGSNSYRANPCPLCGHNDSFTVFEKDQSWKCFSCGEGGDIFTFVMLAEKMEFLDALKKIATETGYKLEEKKLTKAHKQRAKTQDIFKAAVEYYQGILLKDQKALGYLKKQRKRNMKTIKRGKYGFSNGNLFSNLKYDKTDLIDSGLVREKNGRLYDFFSKGLFIYPVYHNKKIVDFFCKDYFELNKDDKREYQLPGSFKLSNPMFFGKDAIYQNEFILCEGPEDRLSILQNYDIPTCAILGSLSGKQTEFIKEHIHQDNKIYLAFDPDRVGKKYEQKIMDGLCGSTSVLKLIWDDDVDIDDAIKKSKKPHEFIEDLLEHSKDAIQYYIDKLPDVSKMPPHIASGYWEPITKWIAAHQQEIYRIGYIESLADRLGSKTRWLQPIKNTIHELRTGKKTEHRSFEVNSEWGIEEKYNKYYRLDPEKGTKKISEFILRINKYIEVNDEIYYEVTLINAKGVQSIPLLFDSKERVNKRQFREKCGSAGSYYFIGTDNDLVEIWQREENLADIKTRTCYFQRYGYVDKHDIWLFSNCAIQKGEIFEPDEDGIIEVGSIGYLSKGVNIYSGDAPEICITHKADQAYILKMMEHFWIMFDDTLEGIKSYKGYLVYGYIVAMVYLREILQHDRKFPYLLVYGPSGTGKSEAIQLMMNILGFRHGGEDWGEATPPGISMAIEQLSSLPYWLEEYKNEIGTSRLQQKKVSLVNNLYNRSGAGKGGLEMRSVREVNGTILFTGQDRPEDKAFLSRAVVIDKETPTERATESFFALKAEKEKLSSIFVYLIRNKSKKQGKDLIKLIGEYREEILTEVNKAGFKNMVDERSIYNYCVLAASFSAGYNYHEYDTDFVKWLAGEVIADVKRKKKEDVLYKFFEDIDDIHDDVYEVVKKVGNLLYLRFSKIYLEWKKVGSRIGMSEYLSKNAMLDYMKNDHLKYWHGHEKNYFGGHQQRAIVLIIDRLPDNIKEIVDGWNEEVVG